MHEENSKCARRELFLLFLQRQKAQPHQTSKLHPVGYYIHHMVSDLGLSTVSNSHKEGGKESRCSFRFKRYDG